MITKIRGRLAEMRGESAIVEVGGLFYEVMLPSGLAARLAMETPDLGYEVFYVLSSPEAEKCYDVAYTRTRLGWKAQHDFMWLPPAEDLPK